MSKYIVCVFDDSRKAYEGARALEALDLEIIAGRDFSREFGADTVNYIVNERAAEAMGMDRYFQSVELYPATGEYSDYAYMVHGTLAVTVELSSSKTPRTARLPGVVRDAALGTVAYVAAIRDQDRGRLLAQPRVERAHHPAGVVGRDRFLRPSEPVGEVRADGSRRASACGCAL